MTVPRRTIERAREEADLLALTGLAGRRRTAGTNGGEWKGPCPFCGGSDRFCVWPEHPDGCGRWWCRQCKRSGDAIDFVREKYNLDFDAAIRQLLGGTVPVEDDAPDNARAAQRRTTPATAAGPPPTEWQETVWPLVDRFQEMLWSDAGRGARRWLHERYGLRDDTIRAWRLGYCPRGQKYAGIPGGFVHRGITIPWWCGDDLWAVKVRLPVPDGTRGKYRRIACDDWTGAREALYGVQHWDRSLTDCFTTEGEFDAMHLWQASAGRANVLTAGNDSSTLADRWIPLLLGMERVWIATDADHDRKAARYWFDVVGQRGRRAAPPGGYKDVTDAWRAGEDVQAWVQNLLDRLTVDDVEADEAEGETGIAEPDEFFEAACARLEEIEDRERRHALYDRLEDALLEGDMRELTSIHTEVLTAARCSSTVEFSIGSDANEIFVPDLPDLIDLLARLSSITMVGQRQQWPDSL